mmetsp:Transcript_13676/g.33455  ORF Transcript_13676/g.33455 Transcript_13676/m.33455 type:complete len:121 (+) Transcript_13676:627-989(+)
MDGVSPLLRLHGPVGIWRRGIHLPESASGNQRSRGHNAKAWARVGRKEAHIGLLLKNVNGTAAKILIASFGNLEKIKDAFGERRTTATTIKGHTLLNLLKAAQKCTRSANILRTHLRCHP